MDTELVPQTPAFINKWDLHTSAKAGDILRVKYLVEQMDADVNERDVHNSSPLFYACLCGHVVLVKYLLDCGSTLIPGLYETERCFYGALTPSIQNILREHKANPNKFDLLAQNMQGLRSIKLFTDIKLIFEDNSKSPVVSKSFDLHKFILSTRSSWFSQHFQNDWKSLSEVTIDIKSGPIVASLEAIACVIEYLYTSKVDVDIQFANEVADLCQQLDHAIMANKVRKVISKKDTATLKRVVVVSSTARQQLTTDLGNAFLSVPPNSDTIASAPHLWHDICLEIKDDEEESELIHRFLAHRALLCQHSAYFTALLTGGFKEARILSATEGIPIVPLELPCPNPNLIRVAIEFLYTNTLDAEHTTEETIALLQISDQLMVMELKRLCAVRLRRGINMETVLKYLQLGDLFQIRILRQSCLDYIEVHIQALYEKLEFADLLRYSSEEVKQELQLYMRDKGIEVPVN